MKPFNVSLAAKCPLYSAEVQEEDQGSVLPVLTFDLEIRYTKVLIHPNGPLS